VRTISKLWRVCILCCGIVLLLLAVWAMHFSYVTDQSLSLVARMQGIWQGEQVPWYLRHGLMLTYIVLVSIAVYLIAQLRHIPRGARLAQVSVNEADLEAHEWYSRFTIKHDFEFVADAIKRTIRSFGFHVLEMQSGREVYFWAEKHRLKRWGMYIIHLGLLVVVSGAILGLVFGLRNTVVMVPGSQHAVGKDNLVLHFKEFDVDFYETTTAPRYVKSTVELFEAKHSLVQTSIEPNSPMEYDRIRFYQGQFDKVLRDVELEIEIPQKKRKKSRRLRLRFNEIITIDKSSLQLRLDSFVPDFAERENGEVYSRTPEWNNPAVLISVFKKKKLVGQDWLFSRAKDYQRNIFRKGVTYSLKLLVMNPTFASEFFISYDPGLEVVWVGCGLVLIGASLLCFFINRTVTIIVKQSGRYTAILVAGETERDSLFFNGYFKKICGALKNV